MFLLLEILQVSHDFLLLEDTLSPFRPLILLELNPYHGLLLFSRCFWRLESGQKPRSLAYRSFLLGHPTKGRPIGVRLTHHLVVPYHDHPLLAPGPCHISSTRVIHELSALASPSCTDYHNVLLLPLVLVHRIHRDVRRNLDIT